MYIMSIDQGTTGTTVSLIDQAGGLVAQADQDHPQHFPKPGWVEHNPEDIWNGVLQCMRRVIEKAHVKSQEIAAIGITNQRETVIVWDRESGKPIHNAIVWQCRRTEDFCQQLRKKQKQKTIAQKTGLVIDPYFSASKIRWILKNVPGAEAQAKTGKLLAGTVDSFVLWRLTGGRSHKTDVSNASRTMLMNIQTGKWDLELCKLFGVPAEMLPEITPSSGEFGKTANLPGFADGIPIAGIAGDQQAALFGQAGFQVGDSKCTYGTGSFLLMNTGHRLVRSKARMLTTVAWQLNGQKIVYALEGGAFICGAAVQWLRDGLGLIQSSPEVETLAKSVSSSEGVMFIPALTGLGAPYWKADARGAITGLTRGSTRAHIARATLEAMAMQNTEILLAMQKDLGKKLTALKVDGGACQNNLLMQMQSDQMGIPVQRPKNIESTSMGAAYLAGLGVGFWSDTREIQSVWRLDKEFKPIAKKTERDQWIKVWREGIKRL